PLGFDTHAGHRRGIMKRCDRQSAHPDTIGEWMEHVSVEVYSIAHPQPGPRRHTFRVQVEARIAEGDRSTRRATMVTVHHPRAWMGIEAGFGYDIDSRMYPTFEDRAACAFRHAIGEISSEEMISVALLGSGRT
ncbi:MAG: hypothetical protein OEM40_09870, partial [Acidimicrobiia bacterium]|nr:hypothetical protein [Acidimicrobiia bacterium]